MKSRDKIPCSQCGGNGVVPLHYELAQTLSFVRQRGMVTSGEVHTDLMRGVGSVTAANNRLELLRRLGFVERRNGRGKAWLYWAPMKKKAKP